MADYLFPLKDRKEVAEGTMAFWFDTASDPDFTFEAGQNADYTLIDPPYTDAEGNTRTFSFAAAPSHTGSIMITTRTRGTAFKKSLQEIPLGTNVKMAGPSGDMTLHEDPTKPAVFLAGGIGITPFRSMIEDATVRKLPHLITLLYSNRTPAATAFLDDLVSWEQQNHNFTLVATVTDDDHTDWPYERGIVDMGMLNKHLPNILSPIYYLAGPPGMVDAMRKMLLAQQISKDHIRIESFSGY